MLRASLTSVLGRKLRLLMSAFAVILGVAFVAGSFIFTDTLAKSFDGIMSSSVGDVVVRPVGSKETGGFVPIISHLAVSIVVHGNNVVLFTERNDLFKELHVRSCSRRVVWIIKEEQLCLFKDVLRDRVQVRQEIILGSQRQWIRFSAGKKRPYFVNRIPRIGIKYNIPRIDKSERNMCNRFL